MRGSWPSTFVHRERQRLAIVSMKDNSEGGEREHSEWSWHSTATSVGHSFGARRRMSGVVPLMSSAWRGAISTPGILKEFLEDIGCNRCLVGK
jgi:hypothetical protein